MFNAHVLQEYRALETRLLEAMRPSLSEITFSKLALEVFAFQCRWNNAYRAFAASAPTPRNWREIPAVPQAAFKRSRLSCVPLDLANTVFRTSGTTGETRGEHYFFDMRLYDASIIRTWDWLGMKPMPIRIIAPRSEDSPDSSLSHMFSVLSRERSNGNVEWYIGRDGTLNTQAFHRSMKDSGPVVVLGTALGFLNLFEQLDARRVALPIGSLALETGGYKGSGRELAKRELYLMFEQFLGLPKDSVINEYGMTELSSQFYTRGLDRSHAGPPWVKVLVINPETGREAVEGSVGILRIFDLANLNSALAVETRDLAIRRRDGFELLGRDPAALPRGCSRAADELLKR